MHGIAYWIEKRARITPTRIAVIANEQSLTYQQMNEQIQRVANYLRHELQVKKGDRIGILSQNSLEYVLLLFAIAKLGAIAVPFNIRLTPAELDYQFEDSGIRMLCAQPEFAATIELIKAKASVAHMIWLEPGELPWSQDGPSESSQHSRIDADDGRGDDPYIICYTSGTTGKPKGAVLTQENMFWNSIHNVAALDLTSEDCSIVLLPLFHIGGIGLFAFPTWLAGGCVVVAGKFDPDKAIQLIETHRVTIVMGVPAIHEAIRQSPLFATTSFDSVRWFYNGGAPCPMELIQHFQERGLPFGQGYGLTETSPTVFMIAKEDARRKAGSIGKPVMFCEVRLISDDGKDVGQGEIGELLVKGPNVMKEYWNRPEETAKTIRDGWLYTGDLARFDEEGFAYIVGRRKDMIISGGENIYPLELEQVIGELDGVQEAAVVGVPDEKWGEVAKAFIVPKSGAVITEAHIKEHCEQRLAKYKIPKSFVFLTELPRNATGKIVKQALTRLKTDSITQ
ncbi:o-succinylbenzoate--CoA ligase [Brevibacillus brevis]|uniref:o-succinylbenzoate--CoA ligase n=1 Tax=Brevibacillus brevis TaxID=1393 RepID=UPI001F48D922|nr:o-succinylbenzoate--CoA ligase [Brevibacillus brevis]UIO44957.1 o-succinylbenzoate--CoA ligase [Brevibacillus brevis]